MRPTKSGTGVKSFMSKTTSWASGAIPSMHLRRRQLNWRCCPRTVSPGLKSTKFMSIHRLAAKLPNTTNSRAIAVVSNYTGMIKFAFMPHP